MFVFICQINCFIDNIDFGVIVQLGFVDMGIDDCGFDMWIGVNQQDGVCVFDIGDCGIEEIVLMGIVIDFGVVLVIIDGCDIQCIGEIFDGFEFFNRVYIVGNNIDFGGVIVQFFSGNFQSFGLV